jgi:hypothetical protein
MLFRKIRGRRFHLQVSRTPESPDGPAPITPNEVIEEIGLATRRRKPSSHATTQKITQ